MGTKVNTLSSKNNYYDVLSVTATRSNVHLRSKAWTVTESELLCLVQLLEMRKVENQEV